METKFQHTDIILTDNKYIYVALEYVFSYNERKIFSVSCYGELTEKVRFIINFSDLPEIIEPKLTNKIYSRFICPSSEASFLNESECEYIEELVIKKYKKSLMPKNIKEEYDKHIEEKIEEEKFKKWFKSLPERRRSEKASLIFDDFLFCSNEKLMILKLNEKYGLINSKLEWMEQLGNKSLEELRQDNEILSYGDFIKMNTDETLEVFYDDYFSGLKDKNGNMIIPAQYDETGLFYVFKDIIVANNLYEGVIDLCNKKLIDFIYDSILPFGNYYIVQIENKCGFLTKEGKICNLKLEEKCI